MLLIELAPSHEKGETLMEFLFAPAVQSVEQGEAAGQEVTLPTREERGVIDPNETLTESGPACVPPFN